MSDWAWSLLYAQCMLYHGATDLPSSCPLHRPSCWGSCKTFSVWQDKGYLPHSGLLPIIWWTSFELKEISFLCYIMGFSADVFPIPYVSSSQMGVKQHLSLCSAPLEDKEKQWSNCQDHITNKGHRDFFELNSICRSLQGVQGAQSQPLQGPPCCIGSESYDHNPFLVFYYKSHDFHFLCGLGGSGGWCWAPTTSGVLLWALVHPEKSRSSSIVMWSWRLHHLPSPCTSHTHNTSNSFPRM